MRRHREEFAPHSGYAADVGRAALFLLAAPVMLVAWGCEAWKAWRLPRYRTERFRRGRRV